MERKHKIIELQKKLIIESTKRKLNAIEKGKIIKINELEEDLRIETVKRRIKEKSVSFKMKKKIKIKIIKLEIEIKVETINKAGESKIEILREVIKKVQRIEHREKIKKQRNEKTNNTRKQSKSLIKYVIALFFMNLIHINIMDLTVYN